MLLFKLILPICILLSCSTKKNVQDLDKTELIGTEWKLVRIGNTDLVTAGMDKYPFLIIHEDGKSEGYGGCNQFHTKAIVKGQAIGFSQIASTRRFCPQNEKETEYFTLLESAVSYLISKNTLLLNTSKGSSLTFIHSR